jgi:ADP-heptose:LPS heptosyltransferase
MLSEANPVVVLFAGALGDFLLALPALRLLRRRHAGPLTLAVRGPLAGLAGRAACADRVVRLDDAGMARFLGGDRRPDWWPATPQVYSWFGGDDPSLRERLSAGVAAAAFMRVVRGDGVRHAALEYCAAVGEFPDWAAVTSLGAVAAPRIADGTRSRLVVHRGAGSPAKRWRSAGFADVAAWWRGRGGEVTELLGPAEERDPPLADASVLRDAELPALADVLAGASLFVGNDSGISHLASACGVAGVVLFGPTEPRRWRPLSPRLSVVRAEPPRTRGDGFTEPAASAVIERLSAALP